MITQIVLAFFIFLWTLDLLLRFRKPKVALPPGPIRWPVIGNVIELALADLKYPHLAFDKLSKEYGEVMSVGLGIHPAVVLSSYSAMKEILTKDCVTSRYPFPFVLDRSFNKGIGIIWGNGTNWRDVRRYTLSTLRDFGFGKKCSLESVLQEEIRHILEIIRIKASKNDGILSIDTYEFGASAVNIIWSMVGGYRFPVEDETFKEFVKLDEKQMEIMSHNNIYNPFPFLRHWFPKWTHYDRHLEIHKEIQDFMRDVIKNMRAKRAARENSEPQNFIDVFLDKVKEDTKSGNPHAVFTEEQLVLVLMDLFLAGSETSGTILVWTLLYLVLNPKVQAKIQDEISQAVPSDQEISLSDVPKMPYSRAVMYEVLRLSNFAPMPPPRIAIQDFQYRNYTIPKGSAVMWNIHTVMMDKEFWGDPETFRPERFLDETGTQFIKSRTERLMAVFGFGKRICLGESVAGDISFMYITNFLRAFSLEVVPGKEPSSDDPISGMTIGPRPYCVKINFHR